MIRPSQTIRWIWALDTRLIEIMFGSLMIMRGVVLTLAPDQMSGRSYQWFLDILPIGFWALLFFLFGFLQMAGVLINGQWHNSPSLRKVGLLASMVTYSVMTTGFVQAEAWLAVSVYGTIAAGAFWCLLHVSTKN